MTKWEDLNRDLPKTWWEGWVKMFSEKQAEGKKLYMLTLMFGYTSKLYRRGSIDLTDLNERVQYLWICLNNHLYSNGVKWRRENCGVVFWDRGDGLHAHCVIAVDEAGWRGKYLGMGFLRYWEEYCTRFIKQDKDGKRDVLIRSHLQRFDGSEQGFRYCGKSLEGSGGLGLDGVVLL